MFGTYVFSYQPHPDSFRDPSIRVSFSSEADLPEMLGHFENFLRAAGYPLEYNSRLVVSEGDED